MTEVLIIAEHRRGELRPVTLELVTAAKTIPSAKVTVAVIADEPANLVPSVSVPGVDEVVTLEVAAHDFEPDTYETAVKALIDARHPSMVLVPHSIDSFGYAAALAAKGAYGFATDVFKIDYLDGTLVATRAGYGQKVNVEVDFPGKDRVMLAIRGNVFKPPEGTASPPCHPNSPLPRSSRASPAASSLK